MLRNEIKSYTVAEARSFPQEAGHGRLEARWLIALSLGLRQGETLGLGWNQIDFNERLLRVDRALQRQPDGSLAIVQPKTQRSTRVVPIPPSVFSALERRLADQSRERETARDLWRDSDLVVTTGRGTAIHPRNDYRAFQQLVSGAGLRRVRLHDLRHTAASLLLSQGVAARVVMEILGHSQISITMNTYTHVDPQLNREATDQLERLLWAEENQDG